MSTCVFKTKDLKRCIEHAFYSKTWIMPYSKLKPQPGLLFVHDQGIYCISNGEPRDLVSPESSYCAYALHCDPNKDENFYDNARILVGGDDFGEVLVIQPDWLNACDEYNEFHVDVTPYTFETYFLKPKKRTVKIKK